MKNTFSVLRSKGVKMAAALSAFAVALASQAVFAIDTTAITAAQEGGVDAVTVTVGGLILIVAVGIGINMVLKMMNKA